MYLYCISILLLYFFIATHSTTTKLFLPLHISYHLIRLSSSLQWSQHGRSWSTRATLGTTTVTPRPSAFRWRARPSSASVPPATEEMGATVTVRPYTSARSALCVVTQVFETANVNKCFMLLCWLYCCLSPSHPCRNTDQIKGSSWHCVCVSSTSLPCIDTEGREGNLLSSLLSSFCPPCTSSLS